MSDSKSTPHTIHIIGGEKGGIGKTTFAIALVEYYLKLNLLQATIDVDRTNPVVGLTYAPDLHRDTPPGNDYDRAHFLPSEQGSNRIYFSSKGEEFFIADRIYERALESDVVLVLPSQIHGQVCEWIKVNGLIQSEDVKMVVWFLTDGSSESLSLLRGSLADLAGIPHILVKNQHFRTDTFWHNFDRVYAQDIAGVTDLIDLPQLRLPSAELLSLRNEHIPLSQVGDRVGILSRNRLKTYLELVFAEIEKTKMVGLPGDRPTKPSRGGKKGATEEVAAVTA
jgi:hypothetical protein